MSRSRSQLPFSQSFNPVLILLDHPRSVGESYFSHLKFAMRFGGRMVGGGLACLVHAVFPFLFVTTGSRTVRNLHQLLMACPHRSVQQEGSVRTDALSDQANGDLPLDDPHRTTRAY